MYSSHWFFFGTWSVSGELTCVSSQQLNDRWWVYHIRPVTKIVQYRNSVCFSECVPWTFCWNHHEFGCWVPILHPDLLSKNWVTDLSSLLQIWDMELGSNQRMESLFHLVPKVRSGLLAGCFLVMRQPNLNPTKGAALWFKQGRWCSVWWHKQILCLLKQTENLHWNWFRGNFCPLVSADIWSVTPTI